MIDVAVLGRSLPAVPPPLQAVKVYTTAHRGAQRFTSHSTYLLPSGHPDFEPQHHFSLPSLSLNRIRKFDFCIVDSFALVVRRSRVTLPPPSHLTRSHIPPTILLSNSPSKLSRSTPQPTKGSSDWPIIQLSGGLHPAPVAALQLLLPQFACGAFVLVLTVALLRLSLPLCPNRPRWCRCRPPLLPPAPHPRP